MGKAAKEPILELGKEKYNADFLRTVSEEDAMRIFGGGKKSNKNQIKNAWKQANGLSVRNHDAEDSEESK